MTESPESTVDVTRWASLFGQLGDSTRLRILLALHGNPRITVTDLAATVGVTPNAASHALAGLAARDLAEAERDGRQRRWKLKDDDVHQILHRLGAAHTDLHPAHDH